MNNKPNIVLLVSDDHGKEVGCYGNNTAVTPNIDSLAEAGIKFDNAFCTCSTCSPSRSVILTGLHNHTNGMYGLNHSFHNFSSLDNITSLPQLIKKGNYRTGQVGKYHVGPREVYPFDEFIPGAGRNDVQMSENCRSFIEKDEQPFFLYWCSFNPHRSGEVVEEHPQKPNRFGNPERTFAGDEE